MKTVEMFAQNISQTQVALHNRARVDSGIHCTLLEITENCWRCVGSFYIRPKACSNYIFTLASPTFLV
jgi:hypothetical protein